MSDQSRLFLAAVLMLGVLLISWFVTGKGNNQQVADVTMTAQQTEQTAPLINQVDENEKDIAADSIQTIIAEETPDYQQRTVTVIIPGKDPGETIVVARLSTTGGTVESWLLNGYEDHPDQNLGQMVDLAEKPWLVSRTRENTPICFNYSGPDTVFAGELGTEVTFVSGESIKTYTFVRGFYGFST